jgi:thiol-disulfide isomerase/thioredoxin
MKSRWTLAAIGAVGVALIVLALVSTRFADDSGTPPAERAVVAPVSEPASGTCDTPAKPAPLDFTLTDMDGKRVDLAAFKGRPLVLNFWATWCGPCKSEIPMFVAAEEKYRENGFTVLGVSVDDPAPALQKFAAEYKMNYPVLMANDGIQDAYGPIFAIPVSIFIKKDGTVCKKHFGPVDEQEIDKDIQALF